MPFLPIALAQHEQRAERTAAPSTSPRAPIITQTTQSVNPGLSSQRHAVRRHAQRTQLRQAKLGRRRARATSARAKQTAVFTVASDFLALVTQQEQLARAAREPRGSAGAGVADRQVREGAVHRPISDLYQQQATAASAQSQCLSRRSGALSSRRSTLMQTLQLDPRGDVRLRAPTVPDVAQSAQRFELDSLLSTRVRVSAPISSPASRAWKRQRRREGRRRESRCRPYRSATGTTRRSTPRRHLSLTDQLDQRRGGSIGSASRSRCSIAARRVSRAAGTQIAGGQCAAVAGEPEADDRPGGASCVSRLRDHAAAARGGDRTAAGGRPCGLHHAAAVSGRVGDAARAHAGARESGAGG